MARKTLTTCISENTLNKTHHSILVWNRNNRLHTTYKKHVYKEWKETTHGEIGEKNIRQYKRNFSTIYVKTVTRPQYTRYDVSKIERKEKKYIKSLLHPSMYTFPLTKISYTNPPSNYDYSFNQNYAPFLSRVTKGKRVK